jgi:hypothetical protein
MKYKIIPLLLLFTFMTNESMADNWMKEVQCSRPIIRESVSLDQLCSNLTEILCRDTLKKERRSCYDNNSIIHKNMTLNEISQFGESCFKSSVNTFKNFFTEFLPELVSSMGKIIQTAGDLKPSGWWGNIKGLYETSRSISADIYENFYKNPSEFFTSLWKKIENSLSVAVDNYECLNSTSKVEKICSFITSYALPPIIFAKFLVKGARFTKEFVKDLKVEKKLVSENVKPSLFKQLLENSPKKLKLTVKEYHQYLSFYRLLGYSEEEFNYLYHAGLLNKIQPEKMLKTFSAEGKLQKSSLLEGYNNFQATLPKSVALVSPGGSNEKQLMERITNKKSQSFLKQKTLIKDLQKMQDQIYKQSKTAPALKSKHLLIELQDVQEAELYMQHDILINAQYLQRTEEIDKAQKRINELEIILKDAESIR